MAQHMADFLGMSTDDFIRLVVLLVVLHDLGKFSSAFQALNPFPDERLWPGKSTHPYDADQAHHDRLGGYFWEKLGQDILALCPDWETLSSREKNKAANNLWVLMESSLGHHGRPIDRHQLELLGNNKYIDAHNVSAAAEFLKDVTQIQELIPASLLAAVLADRSFKEHAKQLSWPLAGIVVLADWLGSNREFFPYQAEPEPLQTYWDKTLAKADRALRQAELADMPTVSPFQSIEQHFQFSPSPLQDWAQKVYVDDTPQLFILEDVTGAGKTEAALVLTHRLLQAGAADGFYFGLPTMATSNAMFNRVADYYLQMLRRPDGSAPSIVLAHGARDMHPAFRQAVQAQDQDDGMYASGDETATMRCNQWLGDSRKVFPA